jgi:hypothetical protein
MELIVTDLNFDEEVTVRVNDAAAPVIVTAKFYYSHRSEVMDTLVLEFSEVSNFDVGWGQIPFTVFKPASGVMFQPTLELHSKTESGGRTTATLVVIDTRGNSIEKGDSIFINADIHARVFDLNDNGERNNGQGNILNIRRLIIVEETNSIISAEYFELSRLPQSHERFTAANSGFINVIRVRTAGALTDLNILKELEEKIVLSENRGF